jgi:hypothetical protein
VLNERRVSREQRIDPLEHLRNKRRHFKAFGQADTNMCGGKR